MPAAGITYWRPSMVKCVLKRRDGFVKNIHRDTAEYIIVMFWQQQGCRLLEEDNLKAITEIDVTKAYFRLARSFTNEYEEEVAVYYEE